MSKALEKRQRLQCDLSAFYRELLSWDYIQLCDKELVKSDMRSIPDRFSSLAEYIKLMDPLLFAETRAHISSTSREAGAPMKSTLIRVETSDKAVILDSKASDGREVLDSGRFMYLTYSFDTMAFQNEFRSLDLVLISEQHPGSEEELDNHVLAVVDNINAEGGYGMVLRVYLADDLRGQKFATFMESSTGNRGLSCWLTKLCNIVTTIRIYTALHTIQNFPLVDKITGVAGAAQSQRTGTFVIPAAIQKIIESEYNPSQQLAIHSGLQGQGFTLIRGPPGTGKSHTIFGLFLALFNAEKRTAHNKDGNIASGAAHNKTDSKEAISRSQNSMPWLNSSYSYNPLATASHCSSIYDPEDTSGKWNLKNSYPKQQAIELKETNVAAPKHILFTAPSNAAVDEVVIRLLARGIPTADGKVWHPRIVRLGPNPHRDVQHVTLNYLVQEAMRSGSNTGSERTERARILAQADMVCTTLSCCGQGVLAEVPHGFDTVVIDEAAQAIELETLIPLKYDSLRCILLGDEKQLPATVFSAVATKFLFQRSFFQRLVESGLNEPVTLNTQYRMHPAISLFPNTNFYDGVISNAPSIAKRIPRQIGEDVESMPLAPFRFFHTDFWETRGESKSLCNEGEVTAILELFHKLIEFTGDQELGSRVGVITLYMDQVKLLRSAFKAKGHTTVDISTVDGFQGREKDIIVLSCVRGCNSNSLGFLTDYRRINVAITRAREALFVVGCATALQRDPMWKKLIKSAKDRHCFYPLTEAPAERPTKKPRKGAVPPNPKMVEILPDFVGMTPGEELAMEAALQAAQSGKTKTSAIGDLERADSYHTEGEAEKVELNRLHNENQLGQLDGEVEPEDLTEAVPAGAAAENSADNKTEAAAKKITRKVSFRGEVEVDDPKGGTILSALKGSPAEN